MLSQPLKQVQGRVLGRLVINDANLNICPTFIFDKELKMTIKEHRGMKCKRLEWLRAFDFKPFLGDFRRICQKGG